MRTWLSSQHRWRRGGGRAGGKDGAGGLPSLLSSDPALRPQINLNKGDEYWWNAILEGEEQIDIDKINKERSMATVDEEEHAVLDRLTFDYHQKLQGKPQSHELVGAGRPAPPAQPCRATHPPAPPWVPSLVTGCGVGQLRRSAPSQSSSRSVLGT